MTAAAPVGPHASGAPSAWLERWAHLIAPASRVLDVACGHGRHLRWAAALGHRPIGVDRDPTALASARTFAPVIEADIENGPWPLEGQVFGAVLVTHYLWRPLLPRIVASLAPDGVLLYETFATGNETVGRPARADFLLRPLELVEACATLRVVAYEHGFLPAPDRFVQRIAAVRMGEHAVPPRHRLSLESSFPSETPTA